MTEKRTDETQTEFAIRVVKEEGAKEFAADLTDRLVKAESELTALMSSSSTA